MEKTLSHKIDWKKVAEGLNLPIDETKKFFNDGRIIGRLGEFIYATKLNSNRSQNENASYDINMNNGDKVEIRSITSQICFTSSKEIGFGRKVTDEGFEAKLNSLDYFVGIDFRNLDELNFIRIEKSDIANNGVLHKHLRKNKTVSSANFYESYKKILNSKNILKFLKLCIILIII